MASKKEVKKKEVQEVVFPHEKVTRLARDLVHVVGRGTSPHLAVAAFAGELAKLDDEHAQAIAALVEVPNEEA
jgi:hypothetical protein